MQVEARGLTFEVAEGGPADGQPVLLLHGFPQDRREFDLLLPRLHAAGLRTYAMDQRGYSPGARPSGVRSYRIGEAVADVPAVLDALGLESAHLVGHDWGAQVAWAVAGRHPERVRTLTAVSVPHPRAMRLALRVRPSQRARLAYFPVFRSPAAERLLLGGGALGMRRMLGRIGPRADLYVKAMREPGRLTTALNWYRAFRSEDLADLGEITVPTTYVWSDRDGVVGLTAALRTADWVRGDYQLVAMRGVGHWVAEEAPRELADAVLARIGV
ncbi:alpha/beta fold hydrolase [Actinoplanes regularis]|uniref:Pimeloyl-ACP methyl ester carboxylesterase n=1 Tax=Actinoplanes regularis TaxID=52697 RepID=A0A239HPH9_9ACTN|nr:alpha/beta hydrolase [Actinoplanes regularis]GIE91111.1 alpha/beta hydrolase [Actinoplanes regularis]GLW32926.1 alpha/beta hydrolase [Actinoplanes regularis]SNS83121.1 Pimeloyl-ACP methyl ester carboxylesterase [Actinoplanes regularis]